MDPDQAQHFAKIISRQLKLSLAELTGRTSHLSQYYSFLASDKVCHLLIIFANSMDSDHAVSSDLDLNCLTL